MINAKSTILSRSECKNSIGSDLNSFDGAHSAIALYPKPQGQNPYKALSLQNNMTSNIPLPVLNRA